MVVVLSPCALVGEVTMPWIKCDSCSRVILVSEDQPKNFLCEKCKPLFDLVWSDDWPVGMTLTLDEYADLKEKILQGFAPPEPKHGE